MSCETTCEPAPGPRTPPSRCQVDRAGWPRGLLRLADELEGVELRGLFSGALLSACWDGERGAVAVGLRLPVPGRDGGEPVVVGADYATDPGELRARGAGAVVLRLVEDLALHEARESVHAAGRQVRDPHAAPRRWLAHELGEWGGGVGSQRALLPSGAPGTVGFQEWGCRLRDAVEDGIARGFGLRPRCWAPGGEP